MGAPVLKSAKGGDRFGGKTIHLSPITLTRRILSHYAFDAQTYSPIPGRDQICAPSLDNYQTYRPIA